MVQNRFVSTGVQLRVAVAFDDDVVVAAVVVVNEAIFLFGHQGWI